MFIQSNHHGSNRFQIERCTYKFKVISVVMAHWYGLWNTIVIAINFYNGKEMIYALMFIISNHHGIKCLSNQLQLELCNVTLNVIYDIMHDLWNTFVIASSSCTGKKMICALMFIISNHCGMNVLVFYYG